MSSRLRLRHRIRVACLFSSTEQLEHRVLLAGDVNAVDSATDTSALVGVPPVVINAEGAEGAKLIEEQSKLDEKAVKDQSSLAEKLAGEQERSNEELSKLTEERAKLDQKALEDQANAKDQQEADEKAGEAAKKAAKFDEQELNIQASQEKKLLEQESKSLKNAESLAEDQAILDERIVEKQGTVVVVPSDTSNSTDASAADEALPVVNTSSIEATVETQPSASVVSASTGSSASVTLVAQDVSGLRAANAQQSTQQPVATPGPGVGAAEIPQEVLQGSPAAAPEISVPSESASKEASEVLSQDSETDLASDSSLSSDSVPSGEPVASYQQAVSQSATELATELESEIGSDVIPVTISVPIGSPTATAAGNLSGQTRGEASSNASESTAGSATGLAIEDVAASNSIVGPAEFNSQLREENTSIVSQLGDSDDGAGSSLRDIPTSVTAQPSASASAEPGQPSSTSSGPGIGSRDSLSTQTGSGESNTSSSSPGATESESPSFELDAGSAVTSFSDAIEAGVQNAGSAGFPSGASSSSASGNGNIANGNLVGWNLAVGNTGQGNASSNGGGGGQSSPGSIAAFRQAAGSIQSSVATNSSTLKQGQTISNSLGSPEPLSTQPSTASEAASSLTGVEELPAPNIESQVEPGENAKHDSLFPTSEKPAISSDVVDASKSDSATDQKNNANRTDQAAVTRADAGSESDNDVDPDFEIKPLSEARLSDTPDFDSSLELAPLSTSVEAGASESEDKGRESDSRSDDSSPEKSSMDRGVSDPDLPKGDFSKEAKSSEAEPVQRDDASNGVNSSDSKETTPNTKSQPGTEAATEAFKGESVDKHGEGVHGNKHSATGKGNGQSAKGKGVGLARKQVSDSTSDTVSDTHSELEAVIPSTGNLLSEPIYSDSPATVVADADSAREPTVAATEAVSVAVTPTAELPVFSLPEQVEVVSAPVVEAPIERLPVNPVEDVSQGTVDQASKEENARDSVKGSKSQDLLADQIIEGAATGAAVEISQNERSTNESEVSQESFKPAETNNNGVEQSRSPAEPSPVSQETEVTFAGDELSTLKRVDIGTTVDVVQVVDSSDKLVAEAVTPLEESTLESTVVQQTISASPRVDSVATENGARLVDQESATPNRVEASLLVDVVQSTGVMEDLAAPDSSAAESEIVRQSSPVRQPVSNEQLAAAERSLPEQQPTSVRTAESVDAVGEIATNSVAPSTFATAKNSPVEQSTGSARSNPLSVSTVASLPISAVQIAILPISTSAAIADGPLSLPHASTTPTPGPERIVERQTNTSNESNVTANEKWVRFVSLYHFVDDPNIDKASDKFDSEAMPPGESVDELLASQPLAEELALLSDEEPERQEATADKGDTAASQTRDADAIESDSQQTVTPPTADLNKLTGIIDLQGHATAELRHELSGTLSTESEYEAITETPLRATTVILGSAAGLMATIFSTMRLNRVWNRVQEPKRNSETDKREVEN